MKLLSIDIETSGLDPENCSILEIGAVLFDPDPALVADGFVNAAGRKWQTFECLVSHKTIQGEPYALAMNHEILSEISGLKKTHRQIVKAESAMFLLRKFLVDNSIGNEGATIVGKNFDAFDARFLEKHQSWHTQVKPLVQRRTLDVGSLCFRPGDGAVKNLATCLVSLGVDDTVSHRALDDALQVATAVTRFFA